MSNEWSNDATTSLTLPTGATNPDQRIVLDGSTDTILVYDSTGTLIASVASTAGTDGFGNNYPAGISATSGVISQSIFLLYNGTPTLGNLVMSLTSDPGTDTFGNVYQSGFTVYDTATGNAVRNIDITGIDTIGEDSGAQFVINPLTGKIEFFSSAGLVTGQIDANTGAILFYTSTTTVSTFTSNATFVVPTNVTSLKVEAWGGGGGGQYGSGAGGGGGEYAQEPALAVTPGESLTLAMSVGGAGGTSASPHGVNAISTTVKRGTTTLVQAHGGFGSTSATTLGGSGSTNTIHHDGGGSHANTTGLSQGGAGGGESGAPTVAGNAGLSNSGSTGGAGGSGTAGFNGGNGGNGTGTTGTAGANVTTAGGGGAGGSGSVSGSNGGKGGTGRVVITYTNSATLEVSIAAVAGTDQFGNSYPQGIQVGVPTASRIYLNPTGPVVNTYDAGNKLNGQWDSSTGRFFTATGQPISGDPSPFITLRNETDGMFTDSAGIYIGSLATYGTLPTSTDLAQAASLTNEFHGNLGALVSLNSGSNTSAGLGDPANLTLFSGDAGTNYSANSYLASGSGKQVINTVDGVYQATTLHDDVVTVPGQVGGGTTTLTITGLGLTAGPNGQWHCLVTADTSVPGTDLKYVSYNAPSSDGVSLKMNRSTNTNTTVSYTLKGI